MASYIVTLSMERIVTWLLASSAEFTARVRDPFVTPKRIYKLPVALVCDALKNAYTTSGRRGQYKDVFDLVSRLGKSVNLQVRIGGALRFPSIRNGLQRLRSYWTRFDGT